jgi:hypothetical protein
LRYSSITNEHGPGSRFSIVSGLRGLLYADFALFLCKKPVKGDKHLPVRQAAAMARNRMAPGLIYRLPPGSPLKSEIPVIGMASMPTDSKKTGTVDTDTSSSQLPFNADCTIIVMAKNSWNALS